MLRPQSIDPTVQEDEKEQPEQTYQVAAQHIDRMMLSRFQPCIADSENINDGQYLEGNQYPPIAPAPHLRREAQVEQEAIQHSIVNDVARWKAVGADVAMHADTLRRRGARASHRLLNGEPDAAGTQHGNAQEDGLQEHTEEEEKNHPAYRDDNSLKG